MVFELRIEICDQPIKKPKCALITREKKMHFVHQELHLKVTVTDTLNAIKQHQSLG